jgi:glycosyltransferase involved in cell wall biosynthesis
MNYATRVMNILISIGSLGLGGAEKQAVWLANEFAVDNKVTLITYHGGKRESELSNRVRWIRLIPEAKSEHSNNVLKQFFVENSHHLAGNKSRRSNRVSTVSKMALRVSLNRLFHWSKKVLKKSIVVGNVVNKVWSIFSISKNFIDVYKTISLNRPKFVITFLYHDTLMIGLATLLRINRPRLIVGRRSPFGYCEDNRSHTQKWMMRWIYRRADAAVSNSSANVPNTILDGVAPERIHLIENFVESRANKFREANEDQLTFVCVANFYDYKNHFNLIKAFAKFNGKIKLTLLGEGPLKVAAIELARDLAVNCKFYGHEDQLDVLTHKMDFFILPSTFEGNSNALLEALIEGFPAITTPVGIASQLQKSGAPVIVTSGFGVEDFAKAINTAIHEKERYSDIAKSFVNIIANAHSKQTIFTQWSSLLDELSASPKGK